MSVQHYKGSDNYYDMACHVFALSGDPTQIEDIHKRFETLTDYISSKVSRGAKISTQNSGQLKRATFAKITDMENFLKKNKTTYDYKKAILIILCTEFGFKIQPESKIKIWGFFPNEAAAPSHMYITYNDIKIYDTMPNHPIRRDNNDNGCNPPALDGDHYDQKYICCIEVGQLAPGTMKVINTPDTDWEDGWGTVISNNASTSGADGNLSAQDDDTNSTAPTSASNGNDNEQTDNTNMDDASSSSESNNDAEQDSDRRSDTELDDANSTSSTSDSDSNADSDSDYIPESDSEKDNE